MTRRCCGPWREATRRRSPRSYDRHAGWLTVRMTRRCAHAGRGRPRGPGHVPGRVARRRCLSRERRRGRVHLGHRHPPPDRRDPPGGSARGGCAGAAAEPEVVVSAEDQVLVGIEHGRLGPALAELSPELRGAIEATVLDGLTCAEAAVLLGVAEGTVKSRCHRARVALRTALAAAARTANRHTAKPGGRHDEFISRPGLATVAGRGPAARYAAGSGTADVVWSVEAHLTGVPGLPRGAGRARGARSPRAQPLGAADSGRGPDRGRTRRLLCRCGMPDHMPACSAATPSLRRPGSCPSSACWP